MASEDCVRVQKKDCLRSRSILNETGLGLKRPWRLVITAWLKVQQLAVGIETRGKYLGFLNDGHLGVNHVSGDSI